MAVGEGVGVGVKWKNVMGGLELLNSLVDIDCGSCDEFQENTFSN